MAVADARDFIIIRVEVIRRRISELFWRRRYYSERRDVDAPNEDGAIDISLRYAQRGVDRRRQMSLMTYAIK